MIDYTGEIFISGHKVEKTQALISRESASRVQMIFQDTGGSLNPRKKIGWLMEEPLVIHKIGTKEERSLRVDQMLSNVGLDPSYKQRMVHELSGGQKQRICIGRTLILKPRLLIADETISSLDVSIGAQILNLYRELHKSLGLAILFISHNKDAVEYLCDRIILMENGEIRDTC
jgi:ABC-type dipeptide/oligopeptide/nickel transport system ATPase subunit